MIVFANLPGGAVSVLCIRRLGARRGLAEAPGAGLAVAAADPADVDPAADPADAAAAAGDPSSGNTLLQPHHTHTHSHLEHTSGLDTVSLQG